MANLAKLVASISLAFLCTGSYAGYAQLAAPSGWVSSASAGAAAGPGGAYAGGAANASSISGGVAGQAVTNVGGRAVTMPAAMRFAANAGRFAARGLVGGGVIGAAVAGAAWLAQNCFAYEGGQWVRTCGGNTPPQSDGYEYRLAVGDPWVSDPTAACMAIKPDNTYRYEFKSVVRGANGVSCRFVSYFLSDGKVANPDTGAGLSRRIATTCPAGWYITPAGCMAHPPPQPVTPREIEDEMEPKPIPPGVPSEIPGVPLPIEIPKINPTPFPDGTPSPVKVPTGNPVPVPNTDPQKYDQPWITIKPAPTPGDPWRVDVQPDKTQTLDPTPQPGPVTVTPGTPEGTKTPEEQKDICQKYPDILACQKLDTPTNDDLTKKEIPVSVTPDGGWGGGGSCPPPRHLTVQGRDIPIPFDLFCQYMAGIRPVIIALAWLSAGFILLGARGGD